MLNAFHFGVISDMIKQALGIAKKVAPIAGLVAQASGNQQAISMTNTVSGLLDSL